MSDHLRPLPLETQIERAFFVVHMDTVAVRKALEQYREACAERGQGVAAEAADLDLRVCRIVSVLRDNLAAIQEGLLRLAAERFHGLNEWPLNIALNEHHMPEAHKSKSPL